MTVRELIEVLKQQNPDALVLTNDSEYSGLFNVKVTVARVCSSNQTDKYIGPHSDEIDGLADNQISDAVVIDIKEV